MSYSRWDENNRWYTYGSDARCYPDLVGEHNLHEDVFVIMDSENETNEHQAIRFSSMKKDFDGELYKIWQCDDDLKSFAKRWLQDCIEENG